MPSPALSRVALIVALAISSVFLHAACARSVESELDDGNLFGADAGKLKPQNACIDTVCPAPFATCPGGGLCTTNLTNDVEHCGACDRPCPGDPPHASSLCSGSECRLVCDALFADCNHTATDGCETATESDPLNCGACGNTCKDGVICWRGACGCPSGMAVCGTECKNLDSDNDNCGACDNVCHAPSDPADPAWPCGGLVNPPHTKWMCLSAACEMSCAPGFGNCNKDLCADGCEIDLANDPDNCGTCGHKCNSGQTCSFGQCLCGPGTVNCGGECVDLQIDANNCGSCGRRCPGPANRGPTFGRKPRIVNGSPSCEAGRCSYTCFPGFADCDLDLANGCEVNLGNDGNHCGKCETECNVAAGQPCVTGKCLTKECEAGVVF